MKDLEIISKTGMIDNSDEKIFTFLSDMRNIGKLVPPDVKDWSATNDSCSFSAKGQKVILKIIEKEEFKLIKIAGDEAFAKKFVFWIQLKRIGDHKTAARLVVRAKLNLIEKTAIKKPLQNGLDTIIDYLKVLPY
jgi:hypothetical protein